MTPVLLFPAALAALAALAMPLVIHLARQSEVRPVDFAALRWLDPKPRPRQRLRFDELPLLIARLVLLSLIALWLARPALSGLDDPSPWVAVVPGADLAQASLGTGSESHWLSPGFPALERPPPTGSIAIGSLLRQLDAELPPGVALRVLVPRVLDGVDAERPRLSRAVTWIEVPGIMAAAPPAPQPATALSVRYAPDRAAAVRYLRAAAMAWRPVGRAAEFDARSASTPLPPARGNLVWLVPGPLPDAVVTWIRGGGTALLDAGVTGIGPSTTVVWDDDGAALVTSTRLGAGRMLRLTRAFAPSAMPQLLDPDFPDRLRALFAALPAAPARVAAAAHAPLTGGASYPRPARDVQPWLALVIAGVLLVERCLATANRVRTAR